MSYEYTYPFFLFGELDVEFTRMRRVVFCIPPRIIDYEAIDDIAMEMEFLPSMTGPLTRNEVLAPLDRALPSQALGGASSSQPSL
ncbi:unnamed protein product [Dovyalis caffra]|uniref:Uncharacterized protein n=1 Tax=Dovyalis caffra TaxID=77055 RepID=A0AAV1QQS9_9ROSI|nr:unnamed protein product [Dovyalis caffra]